MGFNLQGRDLMSLVHHSEREILYLIDLARDLKRLKYSGVRTRNLEGLNIALIFEKTSTRTRCAFEVAAYDEGAHVTYIDPTSSQIGHKESMKDTARVLGRMYDAIEYRGSSQENVEVLEEFSGVPVYNGLTDDFHPTQMLADLLTMREHGRQPLERTAFAYIGDARFVHAPSTNGKVRIDHLNDLINSPIRPAAGMFLMMAAVSGKNEIHEVVAMFIGLLLAGAVHVYKSISRTRITVATNGLANPMVSLIEDGIAGFTTLLAIAVPWIGLAFAIPAGIGLGWVYRKTSGPNDLTTEHPTGEPAVVSESSPGRKPKRTVMRRPKTGRAATVQPETPDA